MFIHGTSFIRALMRNVPITLANDEWEKKKQQLQRKNFRARNLFSVTTIWCFELKCR